MHALSLCTLASRAVTLDCDSRSSDDDSWCISDRIWQSSAALASVSRFAVVAADAFRAAIKELGDKAFGSTSSASGEVAMGGTGVVAPCMDAAEEEGTHGCTAARCRVPLGGEDESGGVCVCPQQGVWSCPTAAGGPRRTRPLLGFRGARTAAGLIRCAASLRASPNCHGEERAAPPMPPPLAPCRRPCGGVCANARQPRGAEC